MIEVSIIPLLIDGRACGFLALSSRYAIFSTRWKNGQNGVKAQERKRDAPKVGPFKGPIDHIEKNNARYSSVEMSPIVPGEFAIIAAPAIAPKKRTTMTSDSESPNPHGMMRIVNTSMLAT